MLTEADALNSISGRLTPDERVLWSGGTAKSRLVLSPSLMQSVIPLLCGVVIVFVGYVLIDVIPSLFEGSRPGWGFAVPMAMLLAFVGVVLGRGYYLRANRRYVITTRRAFRVQGGRKTTIEEIPFSEVRCLSICTYPDASGTIAFANIPDLYVLAHLTTEEERSSDNFTGVRALFDIENAADVCDLIRSVIPDVEVREIELPKSARTLSLGAGIPARRRVDMLSTLGLLFGRPGTHLALGVEVLFAAAVRSLAIPSVRSSLVYSDAVIQGVSFLLMAGVWGCGIWLLMGVLSSVRTIGIAKNWVLTTGRLTAEAGELADTGGSREGYRHVGIYEYCVNGRGYTHRLERADESHPKEIELLYDPADPADSIRRSDFPRDVELTADTAHLHYALPKLLTTCLLVLVILAVLLLMPKPVFP